MLKMLMNDDLKNKKKRNHVVCWCNFQHQSTTPLARTLPPTFHLQNKGGCQTRHISVEVQKMHQPNIYLRNQILRYQRSRIIFGRVSPKITPPKIHKNQPSISRLETKTSQKKTGPRVGYGKKTTQGTSNCSQSFKISDHLKKTCGERSILGEVIGVERSHQATHTKKFKWCLLGITPQKRKNPTNLNQQKSSIFFVSLPKSLMALQACHGWIQCHLANPIQMNRRKFRRKSKGGL